MYNKASNKELFNFRKSETKKIQELAKQLEKIETIEEIRQTSQAIQSACIKIEVSLQGFLAEEWLEPTQN